MRSIEQRVGMLAVLALVVSICAAIPSQVNAVSQVSTSGSFNGGAQSQVVDENGITSGQCAYIDAQGRNVKITYTEDPYGNVEATSREPFVNNPEAALRDCQREVKAGQQQLEGTLQDIFGNSQGQGVPQDPTCPGGFCGPNTGLRSQSFGGGVQVPSSFGSNVPNHGEGVFQDSSSFSGFGPSIRKGFQGSSYWGSNYPSSGQGVFQVSSGDYGAQILVVSQDGVTTGLCSYVDEQGRTVRINYTENRDGTVEAESKQKFVTDPVAALGPCKEAVSRQQEQHRQQMVQLQQRLHSQQQAIQRQQQNLQAHLLQQQQDLQSRLQQQQEAFRQQQQSLQQQLRHQQQNAFGWGQFPFTFPNIPFFQGDYSNY